MAALPVRFMSRADVVAAGGADFSAALADVTTVLRMMRSGDAVLVPETALPLGGKWPASAYALPARLGSPFDAVGVKWTVHRHCSTADGPGVVSLTLINNLNNGRPRAIVESALLTVMRTAAVSALALETLMSARLEKVAILGASAQARGHLQMLYALFPQVRSISLWNRSDERAKVMLAQTAPPPGVEVAIAGSPAAAVGDADAILCCTASPEPLLDEWAVRPGRLILQIGYHEVSFAAIAASDVVTCDLWGEFRLTSAKSLFQMHRAGLFSEVRLAADLSASVLDGWRPHSGASVYFSSFGLNVFDIALAARITAAAEIKGIGSALDLSGDNDGGRP
jgi:ornithine cyclodeaminase